MLNEPRGIIDYCLSDFVPCRVLDNVATTQAEYLASAVEKADEGQPLLKPRLTTPLTCCLYSMHVLVCRTTSLHFHITMPDADRSWAAIRG